MYVPNYRIYLVKDGSIKSKPHLTAPKDVARFIHEYLGGVPDREHFIVLMLDCSLRPIGVHTVSIGTLDEGLVHPREVFKAAILASAENIIVAHNHPSGDPTPSESDKQTTDTLVKSGEILGIKVLDHIIIGDDEYYSFKNNDLI